MIDILTRIRQMDRGNTTRALKTAWPIRRGRARSQAISCQPDSNRTQAILREADWAMCVINGGGSYWVPGGWEEVWVACLQGLCDSRRGRRELATLREDPPIWR